MSIAADLIADFEREREGTRRMLEAVPEDKLAWKPHEKSWSLGQLAGHVAENAAWLDSIFWEEMDFAQMEDYQPFVPETRAQLLETFAKNAAAFAPQLQDKTDEFLRETWRMKMGDKVLMEEPRWRVIRDIMIHHLVHHRGQLSVYLRLTDTPVPSTYGGTADEQKF